MSTDRLNKNFQEFMKIIYNWPTSTIEKSILIEKLEELSHQNPELQHIYDDVSTSSSVDQFSDSQLKRTDENSNRSSSIRRSNISNLPSIPHENPIAKKGSNLVPNITLVKEGDLTVRKGSTILIPLLKKFGLKSVVFCELSYTYCENEKIVYLTIHQSRKYRKVLYQFIIDHKCSFLYEDKRDFQFKHDSSIEYFTTETGTADTWISSLAQVSVRPDDNVEEIYEIPDDLSFTPGTSFVEQILDTPLRPPPRPPRPPKLISPENIYVCLYDHYVTTNDPYELEFNRGDLLYILNTDSPNFYVGHRLILPLSDYNQTSIGLVFKEYIRPAYEKVS